MPRAAELQGQTSYKAEGSGQQHRTTGSQRGWAGSGHKAPRVGWVTPPAAAAQGPPTVVDGTPAAPGGAGASLPLRGELPRRPSNPGTARGQQRLHPARSSRTCRHEAVPSAPLHQHRQQNTTQPCPGDPGLPGRTAAPRLSAPRRRSRPSPGTAPARSAAPSGSPPARPSGWRPPPPPGTARGGLEGGDSEPRRLPRPPRTARPYPQRDGCRPRRAARPGRRWADGRRAESRPQRAASRQPRWGRGGQRRPETAGSRSPPLRPPRGSPSVPAAASVRSSRSSRGPGGSPLPTRVFPAIACVCSRGPRAYLQPPRVPIVPMYPHKHYVPPQPPRLPIRRPTAPTGGLEQTISVIFPNLNDLTSPHLSLGQPQWQPHPRAGWQCTAPAAVPFGTQRHGSL